MDAAAENTAVRRPMMRAATIGFVFCVPAVFGLSVGVWERAFDSGDFSYAARRLNGPEKGLALILAGRTDEAMRLLEGRRDTASLRLYGYAACCEGRWALALEAAKELLQRNGKDKEAQAILAEALLALGDRTGAEAELEKLPSHISAYVRLRVALKFGNAEKTRSAAAELERLTGYAVWRRIAVFSGRR